MTTLKPEVRESITRAIANYAERLNFLQKGNASYNVAYPPVENTDVQIVKNTTSGEYFSVATIDARDWVKGSGFRVLDHPAFDTSSFSAAQKVALTAAPNPWDGT